MVGLLVRFNENDSNILKKLFDGINFDFFDFDIASIESYESDMPNGWDYLSELDYISSEQAKNRILNVNDIQAAPEFLELYIRPKDAKEDYFATYGEFIQSDYVMSVIIFDHRCIEICCKNENWLSKICDNIASLSNIIHFTTVRKINEIKSEALLSIFRPRGSISIYDE